MQGSRTYTTRKKSRIIIDKSFSVFSKLNVGDVGQMRLSGGIDAERLEMCEDDVERMVKTIRMSNIELVSRKDTRR